MDSQVIKSDVDRMVESMGFYDIARFRNDSPWKSENKLQDYIESRSYRRLESDAEHSWHLADLVLLVGPHFPMIDLGKAVQFAILHDKTELFTGDDLAIGLSGNGSDSHAFNDQIRQVRQQKEDVALRIYLRSVSPESRKIQTDLFEEYRAKESSEARFVDALDKLDVLVWIIFGKAGRANPYSRNRRNWFEFAETYHRARIAKFPELLPYFDELMERIKQA